MKGVMSSPDYAPRSPLAMSKSVVPNVAVDDDRPVMAYYPLYKTAAWFFFFLFFCVSNAMIAKRIWVYADTTQLNYKYPPLPDLVHSLDTYVSQHFQPHVLWLPDALFALNLIVVFLYVLLFPQRNRLVAIFCKIWGCLFAIRGTVMPLTILPSPILPCRDPHLTMLPDLRENKDNYSPSGSMYCNDLIFSGHTTINVLCFLFWYFSPAHFVLKAIVFLYSIFSVLATIFTRDHYTVDVGLAIYICVFFTLHFRKEIIDTFRARSDYTDSFWASFLPPRAPTVVPVPTADAVDVLYADAHLDDLPTPTVAECAIEHVVHTPAKPPRSRVASPISPASVTGAVYTYEDYEDRRASLALPAAELSPIRTPRAAHPHRDTSASPLLLSPNRPTPSPATTSPAPSAAPSSPFAKIAAFFRPSSPAPAPVPASVPASPAYTSPLRAPAPTTTISLSSSSSFTSSAASSAARDVREATPAPRKSAVFVSELFSSLLDSPSATLAPVSAPTSAPAPATAPAPVVVAPPSPVAAVVSEPVADAEESGTRRRRTLRTTTAPAEPVPASTRVTRRALSSKRALEDDEPIAVPVALPVVAPIAAADSDEETMPARRRVGSRRGTRTSG